MLLGVIADDFTGAADVGNTLAQAGMATRLYIGDSAIGGNAQAGVVALKSRALPPAEAVALSLAALDRLLAAGCRQILFDLRLNGRWKYWSSCGGAGWAIGLPQRGRLSGVSCSGPNGLSRSPVCR